MAVTRAPVFPIAVAALAWAALGWAVPPPVAAPVPLLKLAPAPQVVPDPGNPLAADVNGDGNGDVILRSGGKLLVLLGDGTGKFAPAPSAGAALSKSGGEVALADVNGDGKLDLALSVHDSYEVNVLLGDGAGGFVPARGSPFAAR